MNLIDKFLTHLSNFVVKYSLAILLLFPLIAASLIFYIVNNLEMNTDTRDMLSEALHWRKLDIEYESLFPHVVDTLVLVVEATTADEAEDYAELLNTHLKHEKDKFHSIYYFKNQDFFKQSSLLYLDIDELYDLSDTLANYQPFLSQLISDQSLGGFLSLLIESVKTKQNNDSINIEPFLSEFNKTLFRFNNNQHYQFSWHSLLSNNNSQNDNFKEIIIVQPKLDYSELFPAQKILQEIRDSAKTIGINSDNGLSLKITGTVALAHEEFVSASKANLIAIFGSVILVTFLLIIGLGSYRLVLITLASLLIGLIYTAGFATWAIGELNLISIAFAVLYIGLGVDFTIHYCLKYTSNLKLNRNSIDSIHTTTIKIGWPLFLCSITTAMGFLAFSITDYKGVAELGLIAGFGMFISLFITLIFLPALLRHIPITLGDSTIKNPDKSNWRHFPENNAKFVIILSVLFSLISLYLITQVRFDYDLLNIQPKTNESVSTFKELLSDSNLSPLRNVVLSKSEDDVIDIKNSLTGLESVYETHSIHNFIPHEQEDKLIVIDELNLLLGGLFEQKDKQQYTLSEIKQRITLLITLLKNSNHDLNKRTVKNLETLLETFEKPNQYQKTLPILENKLFNSLEGRLNALEASLQAEEISLEDLPEDFKSRWINQNNYLIEVLPKNNLSNTENLQTFVKETQAVEKNIIGPPVVSIEAGNAVINAFKLAFIAAFLAVTIFLLILLNHKGDVIYILIPLILASLFTAATTVIFDIPLNFANIIALPLLFGIGVDSAIHIVNQYNHNQAGALLQSSSAKAIFISALTTMLSIGNLALSEHPGTASMGLLLVIGISFALICTLAITPALLSLKSRKS